MKCVNSITNYTLRSPKPPHIDKGQAPHHDVLVQLFASFFHVLWLETQALANVEMHHEGHRPTGAAYYQSIRPARHTQDVHVIILIDWGPLS